MKLACEGCDWSTEKDTADELVRRDDGARQGYDHANMFEGKSEEELTAMKAMMDAHVRQMIVDQN